MKRHECPRGLISALRLLTALPVPGREADDPADALPWFPAVGLLVGAGCWGAVLVLRLLLPGLSPLLLAVGALLAGILLTRGLHLDGLADWADARWGGWTRERRLEIMKDSRLGTFGVLALVTVLLAKTAALSVLIASGFPIWLPAACMAARAVQADLVCAFSYARPDGHGAAAGLMAAATGRHWRTALGAALGWMLLIALFAPAFAAVALVAWAAGRAFGGACRRSFGGLTGDTLGAASECVETLVLVLAAGLANG